MHCLKKGRVAEASRCLSLWLIQWDLGNSTGGTSLIKEKHQQTPTSALQVKGRKKKKKKAKRKEVKKWGEKEL